MDSNNKHSPFYMQEYLEGYSIGQNPYSQIDNQKTSFAYISGFNSGRMDYEQMNGEIALGIPSRWVTITILEEFLLAGLLGLSIEETEIYTTFQLSVIAKWYQSGIEKYDPSITDYLFEILEQNGITITI